jgi:hypothetical protein
MLRVGNKTQRNYFTRICKTVLIIYVCLVVVEALQTIWGNWNKSTKDPESNLAGWSSSETVSTSIYPCQSLSNPDATIPNWRGVFCLKTNINTTSGDSDIQVVSL